MNVRAENYFSKTFLKEYCAMFDVRIREKASQMLSIGKHEVPGLGAYL